MFYIVFGTIVLMTATVEAISRVKRVRRAWYVLRTGDKHLDFAKSGSRYFGVEEREEKKDNSSKELSQGAGREKGYDSN